MAGERIDYTAAAVEAAKSVLIELMHIPHQRNKNILRNIFGES